MRRKAVLLLLFPLILALSGCTGSSGSNSSGSIGNNDGLSVTKTKLESGSEEIETYKIVGGRPLVVVRSESSEGINKYNVGWGNKSFGPYKKVEYILDLNGELAFSPILPNDNRYIYYNGTESQIGEDTVEGMFFKDGQFGYATMSDNTPIFVIGDQEYSPEELGMSQLDSISLVKVIDGNLAVRGYTSSERAAWYNGERLDPNNENIASLKSINGELGYRIENESGQYFSLGGEILYGGYDLISYPVFIDGKPAYLIREDNTGYIYYDGERFGEKYAELGPPLPDDKNVGYIVRDNGFGESFYVYNGTEYGKHFDSVLSLQQHNGKVVYVGKNVTRDSLGRVTDTREYLMIDGKEVSGPYDQIREPLQYRGNLVAIATEGQTSWLLTIPAG